MRLLHTGQRKTLVDANLHITADHHREQLVDHSLRALAAGDVGEERLTRHVQRAFATQPGGAVLDGRDIGTVIAPEAEVKLFVTASVPARAERRFHEMRAQGRPADIAGISDDLAARDLRDATRTAAPLIAAPDAIVLDTSLLSRDEAIARAISLVELQAGLA